MFSCFHLEHLRKKTLVKVILKRRSFTAMVLELEGLLAHAHFNHDPLHRTSQDKKEGQESVDAESLLAGHSLKSSPHLGPGEHDRGLPVG